MKVNLKNVRLSFCDIWEPKKLGDNPKLKYSATFIVGPDSTITFENAAGEMVSRDPSLLDKISDKVLQEKFGKIPSKAERWVYGPADGSGTREAYTNEEGDYYPGIDEDTFLINANKHADRCKGGQLTILDQRKEPITATDGHLFSGCYVNAIIDVYAFENDKPKKQGVTASLEGIQLKKKGEPLGVNQINAFDEFEEEEIDPEDEDDFAAETSTEGKDKKPDDDFEL